jgi:hypothetical protein
MKPAHGWRAANEEGHQVQRPARAHIFALMAAFLAIVAASALWIVNLRSGPRLDGFTGGAMVIFVPFFLLIVFGVWLAIRGALHGRMAWKTVTVLIGSLILASLFVIGYCGPVACFTPGSNRLMGWFVLGGAVLAALVHHLVLNRFTPVSDNGR